MKINRSFEMDDNTRRENYMLDARINNNAEFIRVLRELNTPDIMAKETRDDLTFDHIDDVYLDEIWSVFIEVNENHSIMLSSDDQDRIQEILHSYVGIMKKLL
jgi:hypothetical protein